MIKFIFLLSILTFPIEGNPWRIFVHLEQVTTYNDQGDNEFCNENGLIVSHLLHHLYGTDWVSLFDLKDYSGRCSNLLWDIIRLKHPYILELLW